MRVGFVDLNGPLGQSIRSHALVDQTTASAEFDDVVCLNIFDSAAHKLHSLTNWVASQAVRYHARALQSLHLMRSDHLAKKRIARWLREKEPDIVVAETVPAGYLCVESNPRPPIVVDVHGLTYEQKQMQSGIGRHLEQYWRHVQTVALERAEHVVAVSDDMRRYLQREYSCSHVTVVQNGGYPQAFRAKYSQPLGFLFSGIVEYWESPATLVELSRRLPTGACTVLGSGSLLESVLKSGTKLAYGGSLSHAKALAASSRYQIGLMPSSTDITRVVASPIKMFDYLSVGLPVLASKVGSWGDPLVHSNAGWVVAPHRFVDTAEAILSLDQETWDMKSENGLKLIREQLNWRKIVHESFIPMLKRLV